MAPQPPTMLVTAVCLWLLLSAKHLHAGNHISGQIYIIRPYLVMVILLIWVSEGVDYNFNLVICESMWHLPMWWWFSVEVGQFCLHHDGGMHFCHISLCQFNVPSRHSTITSFASLHMLNTY
jgi:hypothetical protein